MIYRYLHRLPPHGFTLVEVIIVLVILGLIAAVGTFNSVSPMDLSLNSQAEKIASDIRQVQMLAYTTGAPRCIDITANTACSTICATPCTISTLPAIYAGMTLTALNTAPTGIRFNTKGQPTNLASTASYQLKATDGIINVSVAISTGFVSMSVPTP